MLIRTLFFLFLSVAGAYILAAAFVLRIYHGNIHHVNDLAYGTAQLQYVHRLFHTQQNGTDRVKTSYFLQKVIGNITSAEVGENEGVHFFSHQFREGIAVFQYLLVKRPWPPGSRHPR